MPLILLRVVSEMTRLSADEIPASKEIVLRALRVTREMEPTSVRRGKEAEFRDCRMLRVSVSEILTKLGAEIDLRVVILLAVRLPSID